MDMNREPRENFGFWASEDYALTAETKGGRKKKGRGGSSGSGSASNRAISNAADDALKVAATMANAGVCECTII